MDYDHDGVLDFISGSYDPGDVYLFRGLGRGEYAAVEKILDETGTPLVHHPEELKQFLAMEEDPSSDENAKIQARVASFGSWVAPVDWDVDGDLDLLIGSFSGYLYLRENVGSRDDPLYAADSVPVLAADAELRVNSHAAPVVADWNEDGLWDLVLGAADGSVCWFPNVGTPKRPEFGSLRVLVPAKSGSKFLSQFVAPGELPRPGVRAQICVTDYNHDGRLDLIVGDYSDVFQLRGLDEGERRRFDEIAAKERELMGRAGAITSEEERKALSEQFDALREAKAPYLVSEESVRRSFVWLYLRTPRAAPAAQQEPAR